MDDREYARATRALGERGKRECKHVGEYVTERIDGIEHAATWTGGVFHVSHMPRAFRKID